MKISRWEKVSFIDYPEKASTIIFTPDCNYNCGYCHNPELKKKNFSDIDENKIFEYIDLRKGLIDAVVISGGEPTLQPDLLNFIKKIKKLGISVKLDTNGKNYEVLKKLNESRLINYVAMDVKGPVCLYADIIGRKFVNEREDIGKGILIASEFPDYEFRTTIVPVYENEKPRWMTPEEIGQTAGLICNWSSKNRSKYFLQKFKAIEKKEGDERFRKEKLPREMWETPRNHLEECLKEARKYLPYAEIR